MFRLADGQIALHHQRGGLLLGLAAETQQSPGVTAGELALSHQFGGSRGEGQQAQGVGHGAAGFAHPLGSLLLGHVVGLNQGLEPGGLLHGVQVLPLEVFDHGQLGGLAVIGLHDNDGHFLKARQPRSPPAPFSGDDLIVAGGQLPDGKRLDDTVLSDGVGQFCQGCLVKVLARLGGTAFHLGNGQVQAAGALRLQYVVAQQGAETPAEAGGFLGCHGNAPFQRIRRFAFSETPLQRRCRPPRPGRSDHRR